MVTKVEENREGKWFGTKVAGRVVEDVGYYEFEFRPRGQSTKDCWVCEYAWILPVGYRGESIAVVDVNPDIAFSAGQRGSFGVADALEATADTLEELRVKVAGWVGPLTEENSRVVYDSSGR